MSGAEATWRVVFADGRVFPLELVWVGTLVIAKIYGLMAEGVALSGTGADVYDAVADLSRCRRGCVAEIVPPGEPTRAELRAQLAAHQGHTDAAVDGVRTMLPAALATARREGRDAALRECLDIAMTEGSTSVIVTRIHDLIPLDAPAAEGASS